MGFTTWRLERRLRTCEKRLARIRAKIEAVQAKHEDGRLTRAQATAKVQDLEAKAREQHGVMSTVLGNLRKARAADKKGAHG